MASVDILKGVNSQRSKNRPNSTNSVMSLQNENMASGEAEKFWKEMLALCSITPFPNLQAGEYRAQSLQSVSRKLSGDYIHLSFEQLSSILTAAWGLLIARYAESTDVVFGVKTPDVNRLGAESALPTRFSFDPRKSIHECLEKVQEKEERRQAFAHIDLRTLAAIGEDCRIASQYQTLVIVKPADRIQYEEPSTIAKVASRPTPDYSYSLVMECYLEQSGVTLSLHYNKDITSKFRAKRLLYQYQHIIRQLAKADKKQLIKNTDLLSPEDMHQISQWNKGQVAAVN